MSDKLESVRRVYASREKALAQALRKARDKRQAREDQAQGLTELLMHYQDEHARSAERSGPELARLQRFYREIADTLEAHGQHVALLRNAEQREELAWQSAYRSKRAIEDLLERRRLELRTHTTRRERRAQPVKRSDWSMLNRNDESNGGR